MLNNNNKKQKINKKIQVLLLSFKIYNNQKTNFDKKMNKLCNIKIN
jgi:hypothetical protein